MIGSSKRTEDLRNWEKIKLYNSYMLVTFLVIMLLQLSRLSWTLSPRILHIHTIWMSWSYWDCYIISFLIHHLGRNTRPSQGISSSMIVSKSWDLAVLLCETACCILLNVRLNNDRPQLLAVACEGPVKLDCQHHLCVKSILPLITDWPSLLHWCLDLLLTLNAPYSPL